ncbi:MAG: hypothetical protein ACI92I_000856, partial [Acidimicrobiales bacterium]
MDAYFSSVEIHPIDIVETLAEDNAWDFDRVADDQIAMVIEGQWQAYSITLAWSPLNETLRFVCTFELTPPDDKLPGLYEIINVINDNCYSGTFVFWLKQNCLVYQYGLVLTGGEVAGVAQINQIVQSAVLKCERYYPAFQLVC